MKTALLILLSFFCASANAQPYITAGGAWIDAGSNQSDSFVVPGIGYRFGRVSVEASYLSAEYGTSTTSLVPPVQNLTTTSTNDLTGGKLSLLGSLPVGARVELLGIVSAYSLTRKLHEVDTLTTFGSSGPIASVVTGDRSSSFSGTTYSIGAGLSFALTKSIDLRWTMEFGKGKENVVDNFTLINVTAAYRF